MQKTTDIIIVKFDNSKFEDNTVRHLLKNTDHRKTPYHLTVYDNYVKDLHLPAVWNQMIDKSDADYICLLNSDTEPTGNWLEVLLNTYDEYEDVGCVGPCSNCACDIQGGHTGAYPYGTLEKSWLSGMCLVFPKKLWKEVGGFDPRFHIYAEDKDFGIRVKQKGYKNIIRFDSYVFHYGQKTTSKIEEEGLKNYEEINKESKEWFNEKHK